MKLSSMLAVPMAVIMLITILLVGVLAAGSIRSWRDGQAALGRLEQFRQFLVLQELLGLERGRMNIAMGVDPVVAAELAAARATSLQATDRCLRDLAAQPGLSGHVSRILAELSERVTAVRSRANAVIQQPLEHRSADSRRAAIDAMMALPPLMFPAVDEILADISAADPDAASLLTATHAASDLRLYAGLVISKFSGAMAQEGRVTLREIGPISVQQGQVIELHRLLLASISLANVQEQTRGVVEAMEQRYFGSAQQLVDRLLTGAIENGRFSMTSVQLLTEYEPSLAVLVAVRERLFALTRQQLEAGQAERQHRLEATAVAGGAVLLAVLAALLMLHRWVIRPLAELAAMVIRLAEGDRSVRWTARHGSREIAELANAIEVLRVATIEADAAAARRRVELQRWTAQLRQVLDTIDLMHTRAATITDVLPALLEQLGTLAQGISARGISAQGTSAQGTSAQGTSAQGTSAQGTSARGTSALGTSALGTSASGDVVAPPGLALAIAATHAGIDVLRDAGGRLDAALQRMHSAGDGEDMRIDELNAAMGEVAGVVTAIQEAVNGVPHITLSAMRDLSAQTGQFDPPRRGPASAVYERILAQVQEMAAAAGGLQSALMQATHGLGELARLRA